MKKYVMYYWGGKYHFDKPSGERGEAYRVSRKTRAQIIRLNRVHKCGPSVGNSGMRKHNGGI